jgi:hypothetical protein
MMTIFVFYDIGSPFDATLAKQLVGKVLARSAAE